MKKLLTILTFTLACIPTLHSTKTNAISTNTPLIAHIKVVNVEAFINELQELITLNRTATTQYITPTVLIELEQYTLETKKELEQKLITALSQNENIDWKELIKGSLICLPSGLCTIMCLDEALNGIGIKHTSHYYEEKRYSITITPAISYALIAWLSSKILIYGAHIANDGWNYQAQLCKKLKDLDVILSSIQQAKTQIFM